MLLRVVELGRDLGCDDALTLLSLRKLKLCMRDQIDDATELIFGPHRDLDRHGVGVQPLVERAHRHEEVGADAIHLVDEADAGNLVLVRLPPDGFALRLDAVDRIEDRAGAVEHAQGALHLDGEVDVSGGIDDVDAVLLAEEGLRPRAARSKWWRYLVMVMPRSCSCAIQSITAVPSWTSPIL